MGIDKSCKNCLHFKKCKKKEFCIKFFPKKVEGDLFSETMHNLRNLPLSDLLVAESIIDTIINAKTPANILKVGDQVEFMFQDKKVSAEIIGLNKRSVTVLYNSEKIRLSIAEIL